MCRKRFYFAENNQKGVSVNLIQSLEQELENLKREYEKFERGNKSAGTRARKVLQNIKRLCQDMRVQIQDVKRKGDEAEQ